MRQDKNAKLNIKYLRWKYPELAAEDIKASVEYFKHEELLRKYRKTQMLIERHREGLRATKEATLRVTSFISANPRPDKTTKQFLKTELGGDVMEEIAREYAKLNEIVKKKHEEQTIRRLEP
jgi:hypothetical protein